MKKHQEMTWRKHLYVLEMEQKKEPVYHVGNEDVAVPEVHTGKVAHEQAAQQDTGEKENIHYENVAIPEVHIPHKKKK